MACTTSKELYIDDTKIDSLEIDDQEVDFLEIDDVCVWARLIPARLILDEVGEYEWDVVKGASKVQLCMVAGGGGGGHGNNDAENIGGGYAGEVKNQEVAVTPNTTLSIIVGSGAGRISDEGTGQTGGDSIFDTITAAGGLGGQGPGDNYPGDGAEQVTCGGTGNDGVAARAHGIHYGGQSSGFGDGGNGGDDGVNGGDGGIGSGGGSSTSDHDGSSSGAGGRGEVRFTWGSETHPLFQEYTWSTMSQEEKDKLGIRKIS